MTVKRFSEFDFDLDGILRKYIQQSAMGQEAWFEVWHAIRQEQRITGVSEDGQMMGVLYSLPVFQVAIGMRGILLGTDNYVWDFLVVEAPTDTEKSIQEAVERVMKNLHDQRASQGALINGQGLPKEKQ